MYPRTDQVKFVEEDLFGRKGLATNFLRAMRSLSGYVIISPGNNLGDSFNFCRHESIARSESSFNMINLIWPI